MFCSPTLRGISMSKEKILSPTYYTIESDGSESELHIDCFRKMSTAIKERVLIVHDDQETTSEQFKDELNKMLDAGACARSSKDD